MARFHGKILDIIISPSIISIGIIGNIFMLSILLRWMQKYYIDFCFPMGKSRAHRINSNKTKGNSNQGNPMHKSTSLNFPMCIYLSFLTFSDLLCLLMEFSFTLWRANCLNKLEGEDLECNEVAWASINLLISLVNAFIGNSTI